jgi:hypothetical protein
MKERSPSQALVAHGCNPSYSGGRDQEDWGSKPAQANSLWDPVSKKSIINKEWKNGSRCRSWVQTPVQQKKKKKKKDGEIHFLTPGIQSQTGFMIDFDQKIQWHDIAWLPRPGLKPPLCHCERKPGSDFREMRDRMEKGQQPLHKGEGGHLWPLEQPVFSITTPGKISRTAKLSGAKPQNWIVFFYSMGFEFRASL